MSVTSPCAPVPVLLVCGPPCAGKTTVAMQLRDSLGWPLLSKDAFKEILFDSLGWSDRAWSKKLSGASYSLMFDVARELLAARRSCILEGNFRWSETRARFGSLAAAHEVRFIQVFCTADAETLMQRWRARVEKAERHPGHVDADSTPEIEAELRERPPQALPMGAPAIMFDSSGAQLTRLNDLLASVADRAGARLQSSNHGD